MAISVRWTSKTREGRILPLPPTAPVSPAVVEALLLAWENSEDKGAFMTVLPVAQASALCDLITERVPRLPTEPRPPLPEGKPSTYGVSGSQRRARIHRIAKLLGVEDQHRLARDVYTILRMEYGACPVPKLITAEMVAAAAAQIVRPSWSE
jgi:hypothetical protein